GGALLTEFSERRADLEPDRDGARVHVDDLPGKNGSFRSPHEAEGVRHLHLETFRRVVDHCVGDDLALPRELERDHLLDRLTVVRAFRTDGPRREVDGPAGGALRAAEVVASRGFAPESCYRHESLRSVGPLQEVDDRGGARTAYVLSETEVRARDLTIFRLASKLPNELDDLSDADGSERSSLRLQAARRVHHRLSARSEAPARELGAGPTLLHEPEVLERNERTDCVRIVDLRDLDVRRSSAGLFERTTGGDHGGIEASDLLPVLDRHRIASDLARRDPDGSVGVLARQ